MQQFIPTALIEQARQYHQSGQLALAEAAYLQVLEFAPQHADSLHMLGLLYSEMGQPDKAIVYLEKSIAHKPKFGPFHHNLGSVYQDIGSTDAAIAAYRNALKYKPELPDTHHNLGKVHQLKGDNDAARQSYFRALRIKPDYAEAHNNLGMLLRLLGDGDEAIKCLQKAIRHAPSYVEARLNLAGLYRDRQVVPLAIQHYEDVIKIQPNFIAYTNLGLLYRDCGDFAKACEMFDCADQVHQDAGNKFKSALLLPVIPESLEQIRIARERYEKKLDELAVAPPALSDPSSQVGEISFLLAYHGLNDKPLQQKLAQLYERACPSLCYTAPHCTDYRRDASNKIKIGFISSYFRTHSVGRTMQGIINNLSRELFEVHVFFIGEVRDELADDLRSNADHAHVIALPFKPDVARSCIAEQSLDILFYPDIGMDPTTYFLSYARLAPVQCTTWGHLDTTGIANVDYYISNTDAEPENGDEHYSEQLVRLENAAIYPCFTTPVLTGMKERHALGLPEDRHLYICPQSLFKLHPDFDLILVKLLQQDPQAKLILPENKPAWRERLLKRLALALPDVASRIIWMPALTPHEFRNWIAVSDVMLDPLHYGGGVTSMDGFPSGTPIVTLPGALMRGRITYGCYKRMGIEDCIAVDEAQYVAMALRIAQDGNYREQIKARIIEKVNLLFDDRNGLRQLESFFCKAVESA
jgi:protein O-GlcNAc transferase